MDVSNLVSEFTSIQQALNVITLLQLTAYRYPQQSKAKDGDSFDYIIVGAGAAGCVLANRLTEDPKVEVLLIEAGGDPPFETVLPSTGIYAMNAPYDWRSTAPGCNFNCHIDDQVVLHRGKVLGGSSTINYMLYVRGNPHDYDTWARIADDDNWNYDNVLPYFIKSQRQTDPDLLNSKTGQFHGTDGYIGVSSFDTNEVEDQVLASFEEIGYNINKDTNSNDTLGYGHPQHTVADGYRQSTANTYLNDAKDRPNLHVLKNHMASRINIKDKRAVSVEAIDDKNQTKTFTATREIIVSCGSIGSPQLLMLSGIGPKNHLDELGIDVIADLPVGENLQDHKYTSFVYTLGNETPTPGTVDPSKVSSVKIVGFGALNQSQTFPDYQTMVFFVNAKQLLRLCRITYEFNDDTCQYLYDRVKGKNALFLGQVTMHPKSSGRIMLKSTDPFDQPLISTDAFTDEVDLDDQINFNRRVTPIINTTYFKSVGAEFVELEKCGELDVDSEEYMRCHALCMVTPTYHQMGTCAMGSVVDSHLRVFGFHGLRIADASIMPYIVSGNTYAPTIMLAEKAADIIKKDNESSNS